jgi:hypothetical protein
MIDTNDIGSREVQRDLIHEAKDVVACQRCGSNCEWVYGSASDRDFAICENPYCRRTQTDLWAGGRDKRKRLDVET